MDRLGAPALGVWVPHLLPSGLWSPGGQSLTSSLVTSRGRAKHAQAFLGSRQLLGQVPSLCSRLMQIPGCLLWQGGWPR